MDGGCILSWRVCNFLCDDRDSTTFRCCSSSIIAIFIYFVDFLTPRVKKHVVIMLLFLLDYCSCYVHLNMIFFNGIFFPGVVHIYLLF